MNVYLNKNEVLLYIVNYLKKTLYKYINNKTNLCPIGIGAPRFGFYGEGTGTVLFENVGCTGSQTRLLDCTVDRVHRCQHWEDAGAVCSGIIIIMSLFAAHNYTL